jgi:hypothetical protein
LSAFKPATEALRIETTSPASFEPRCGCQMTVGTSQLRLTPLLPPRMPHAVVTATRPERAWLDKITSNRYTCLVASLVGSPGGVQVAKDVG